MRTDLVTRLKDEAAEYLKVAAVASAEFMTEAAQELERLQTKVAHLPWQREEDQATIKRLQRDLEECERTLGQYADAMNHYSRRTEEAERRLENLITGE